MLYGRIRTIAIGSAERDLQRHLIDGAADWLRDLLRNAGVPEALREIHVSIGHPAHEIVVAVERFGADLIVMPSRARGADDEALIGSVARSVLRGAPCPVLIINRAHGEAE